MSARELYRDPWGRAEPPAAVAGPGCAYVGNVRPGRVVLEAVSGARLRIVAQGTGSTTVERRAPPRTFKAEGETVTIKGARSRETIARGTVVRFANAGGAR